VPHIQKTKNVRVVFDFPIACPSSFHASQKRSMFPPARRWVGTGARTATRVRSPYGTAPGPMGACGARFVFVHSGHSRLAEPPAGSRHASARPVALSRVRPARVQFFMWIAWRFQQVRQQISLWLCHGLFREKIPI